MCFHFEVFTYEQFSMFQLKRHIETDYAQNTTLNAECKRDTAQSSMGENMR